MIRGTTFGHNHTQEIRSPGADPVQNRAQIVSWLEAGFGQNHAQAISFNHAIGLPQKNGVAYPLFDYEQMLFDTLQTNKHVWIKKATGLGVTEFMLRYMAWLCFRRKNRIIRLTDVHCNRSQDRVSHHPDR